MSLIQFEEKLWGKGYKFVVGIDEAGRGPWAGPLTAGAVLITDDSQVVQGVTDSKKLNAKKRVNLYEQIVNSSEAWGVGIVSAEQVDLLGVAKAVNFAMLQALNQIEKKIKSKADFLIIDGANVRKIGEYNQLREDKADFNYYCVAAASIIAKVTRDRIMDEYSVTYPEYSFEKHVGYGTKIHSEALETFGPTEIHRFSYKPIAKLIDKTEQEKANWRYWGEIGSSILNSGRILDTSK